MPKNDKNIFTSSSQCHIEYEVQKCIQEHKYQKGKKVKKGTKKVPKKCQKSNKKCQKSAKKRQKYVYLEQSVSY